MEKIPCIKCTPELWKYIRPYLEEWGYDISNVNGDFNLYSTLTLNAVGRFGFCSNFFAPSTREFNRELVTNVEEFLERAAQLMGKTYKRTDIMEINGIELRPGMVIEVQENDKNVSYVVFPLLYGELGVICYNSSIWYNIEYFIKYYSSKIVCIHDLTAIELGGLASGKLLWEKPKKVILSLSDIADRLNVPLKFLNIEGITGRTSPIPSIDEIKPGMVVEILEGTSKSYAMVTYGSNGKLCISGPIYWGFVESFRESLITNSGVLITKVYGLASNMFAYELSITNRRLLWDRKYAHIYTLSEIAKAFEVSEEQIEIRK